jgi:phosphocarrier protein HPr
MQRLEAVIVNKLGLHARPSAKIAQLATRFSAEVWMAKGTRRINAKSIMGVMMLAAAKGTTLVIETTGPDEEAAAAAIAELIAAGFGEEI